MSYTYIGHTYIRTDGRTQVISKGRFAPNNALDIIIKLYTDHKSLQDSYNDYNNNDNNGTNNTNNGDNNTDHGCLHDGMGGLGQLVSLLVGQHAVEHEDTVGGWVNLLVMMEQLVIFPLDVQR